MRAAACRSAMVDSATGNAGSARTPNRAAFGSNWWSNCSRFGAFARYPGRTQCLAYQLVIVCEFALKTFAFAHQKHAQPLQLGDHVVDLAQRATR